MEGDVRQQEREIDWPETATRIPQPEVEMQEAAVEDDLRVAIVGAGGYGRLALDVLVASGCERWILGFYDDAHAVLADRIRGFPVLGDIGMLKSMLSVEPVHVVVAITDNRARLRVANSIRALGGRFLTAVHPAAYLSEAATVGDGTVVGAGAVVQPDAAVGSHCCLGPRAVIDRDATVGAGTWISSGAVVGPGAWVGPRVIVGTNASIGRKAVVEGDVEVEALRSVPAGEKFEGGA
jgi:sugar O-acyltransferase (sialic acid O-acetyltransferase NeuD family)